MASAKIFEIKADLAEISKLSQLAERQRVKNLLLVETRKLETELSNLQDACKMEIDLANDNNAEPKKAVTPAANRCYDVKLTNYAWDQSEKFVKLFVTISNVHTLPEGNVHCDFDTRSVELTVKGLENRNYSFTIKNLLENIDTASSKWKLKKDMVVIMLAKAQSSNWSYLTSVEKKLKEPKSAVPKVDPNEDPTSGLMDLMKKMYDEGDDDMKRTIAKSWTESAAKNKMGF